MTQGWNQNDLNLFKILANFMHMNIHYYILQVMKIQKQKKVREIVNIALDIM